MNTQTKLVLSVVCLAIALGIAYSVYFHILASAWENPIKKEFPDIGTAYNVANSDCANTNSFFGITSGTPSMEPFIKGKVFTASKREEFSKLKSGKFVVYKSKKSGLILHRLEIKRFGKWIVAGDNNKISDPEEVSPANYVGTVWAIYTFPQ
jgi:hypothetical protein